MIFGFFAGRGGEIRTPDILVPNQARYQATLHPECVSITEAKYVCQGGYAIRTGSCLRGIRERAGPASTTTPARPREAAWPAFFHFGPRSPALQAITATAVWFQ